jgi:hypothetical protein
MWIGRSSLSSPSPRRGEGVLNKLLALSDSNPHPMVRRVQLLACPAVPLAAGMQGQESNPRRFAMCARILTFLLRPLPCLLNTVLQQMAFRCEVVHPH